MDLASVRDGVAVSAETASLLDGVGPLDALVGVAAAGHGGPGLPALDAAAAALGALLPDRPTAVLAVDTTGLDGTREALAAWRDGVGGGPARVWLEPATALEPPPDLLSLVMAGRRLGSPACALLDARRGQLSPDQLRALLAPVLAGQSDLACPVYARAASEGTLTSNLLVPLTRALYGRRVTQLAAGGLAVSGALLKRCLDGGGPDPRWQGPGLEIWLATEALASGSPMVEVGLGSRPAEPDSAPVDLATTLVQAVGAVLALMDRHATMWLDVRETASVPRQGLSTPLRANLVLPNTDRMVRGFRLGLKDLLPVWEQIMPEATLARLYPLGLLASDEFRFPDQLWARVISDFAVGHHERRLPQDHLLRALTPLYLGRVAAFLVQAEGRTAEQVAGLIESTAQAFEAEKSNLVARWR